MHEITKYLYITAELCFFLAGILGLLLATKKKLTFPYRILLLYLFLEGIIRLIAILISFLGNRDNLYLYHLLGLIELITIYLIYEKKLKSYWTLSIGIVAIFYAFIYFFPVLPHSNIIGLAPIRFFIIILGMNYLWGLYQKKTLQPLKQIPFFYVNAGFMLYAAGSFFISLMSSKVMKESDDSFYHNAWIIEAGIMIFHLCLITYGFILIRRGK